MALGGGRPGLGMSRTAKVRRFFGDDDHDFKIGVEQAQELQDLFGCGLMPMYERVSDVCIPHIKEVLRVGLIGGGMSKEPARRFVDRHVAEGYFVDAADVAADVIKAALRGAPDEPLGEQKGATDPPPSPMEKSDTESSSDTPPPPESASETSSTAASGKSARRSTAGRKPTARAAKSA